MIYKRDKYVKNSVMQDNNGNDNSDNDDNKNDNDNDNSDNDNDNSDNDNDNSDNDNDNSDNDNNNYSDNNNNSNNDNNNYSDNNNNDNNNYYYNNEEAGNNSNSHYSKRGDKSLNDKANTQFSKMYNYIDDICVNRTNNTKNVIKIVDNNTQTSFNINISNRENNLYERTMIDTNINAEGNGDMKTVNKNKTALTNVKMQDKKNCFGKALNDMTYNNAPNKIINKNTKNLNVNSKIKNDVAITYLTYEDITNFQFEINDDNINDMITKLIEITKDQEWTKQIENLINLRRILKFHHKLFFENHTKELRKICRSIIDLLNSPRSSVSKNALLCLSEFYSIGKKKMDITLDDVIIPCLKKAHQTSIDFLSSAANNALLSICNSCSESKLILHFVKIVTSKQKTYNLICLKCLIAVIIKYEENICKFKEMNKLIEALLECTAGGSAEIKCTARVALVVLDNICPIKQIGSKLHIPAEKIKKIENLTERTSENEIDMVLGKIKFS
ncbi:conserved Plasmodium protein, unknown function [Plasmodium malariae]|uniref:CLASP N-terminal domain-containing protein n=1 Tax=Plasmodium malariae TaxID=5858 RepID=A0A1C3L1N6_PLAMA|nr:conserved Plasmodium protein, unknown function [Plasmodium malariae]